MSLRWLTPALALMVACAPASPPAQAPAVVTSAVAAAPSRAELRALKSKGMAAYHQKDYAACGALLDQARDRYDAACCYAQAGNADAAFAQIARAIDDGVRLDGMQTDSDLAALHGDPRWPRELARRDARDAEHRKTLNAELAQLNDDDQADRRVGSWE